MDLGLLLHYFRFPGLIVCCLLLAFEVYVSNRGIVEPHSNIY